MSRGSSICCSGPGNSREHHCLHPGLDPDRHGAWWHSAMVSGQLGRPSLSRRNDGENPLQLHLFPECRALALTRDIRHRGSHQGCPASCQHNRNSGNHDAAHHSYRYHGGSRFFSQTGDTDICFISILCRSIALLEVASLIVCLVALAAI